MGYTVQKSGAEKSAIPPFATSPHGYQALDFDHSDQYAAHPRFIVQRIAQLATRPALRGAKPLRVICSRRGATLLSGIALGLQGKPASRLPPSEKRLDKIEPLCSIFVLML